MENKLPICPNCKEDYTYLDGNQYTCPMCFYVWEEKEEAKEEIKDVNGNILKNGDTVSIIKDLKINGSSKMLKSGTKVKNIRLIFDAPDDHDISCKIPELGAMKLKSSVVKKI